MSQGDAGAIPLPRRDRPRNQRLDLVRLVLAVLVVSVHARALTDVSFAWGDLLNNGVARIAVPAFFVMNGYFTDLADPAEAGRALRRVLLLYLVWMAAYAPIWLPPRWDHPLSLWRTALLGYWQLWYLSGLVLALGLGHLAMRLPARARIALAMLLFLAGWALMKANALLGLRLWPEAYRNGLLMGLPFVLLGQEMRRRPGLRALPATLLLGAAALLTALLLAEAALTRGREVLLALLALAPLLVLLCERWPRPGPSRALGEASAIIFYVHVAFINVPAYGPTPAFVVALGASLLLVAPLRWLNRRVPVL